MHAPMKLRHLAQSARRVVMVSVLFAAGTGIASAQAMDHGSMQMQGGFAPADARDPDAYSGGYRLGEGLHALPHGDGQPHHLMMADQHNFGSLLVDRLEYARSSGAGETAYDLRAMFGSAYDKLVLKAEGEVAGGKLGDARNELLWGHAVGAYWDTQLGLRTDAGSNRPARSWLAFGIQGLAPYWFEVEATAYVGEGGRTALRLALEYELLITQRLVLQPRVEASFHGKRDAVAHIGSGLATGAAGLRLRYEISRQFAPYVGVERAGAFGDTADMRRAAGERPKQTRWVAGVRMWF